jgi:AraC-like DNA-binding protein
MTSSTALVPGDLPYIAASTSEGNLRVPTGMPAVALEQLHLRHRGGLPPGVLRRVRQYIEEHLEHSVSLKDLAAIGRLSLSHFGRAFKQSEGMSPHDYLLQRRVQRAQLLLACTDMPLSEIALACGFADQSHCSRRFSERVGISPSRYRWSMR